MTKKIFILLSTFYFLLSLSPPIQAAVLYLEPSQDEFHQGDTFIAEIRLNTEGEYINTVKADLKFSQDILEVKDLSEGNSILTLWVKTPAFLNQNGTVSFIGGVPGGYLGWDGLLGRIIFKIKNQKSKIGEIKFLESSQVLLNDGFATPAQLTTKGAILTILPEKIEKPRDEWQEELEKDTIPPEAFEIELYQDPSIFGGKYFIVFSTTDKQTGIDHYEVKEGKRKWQEAESPYLLGDQKLESIIKVKAVDKAGNERTVLIGPFRPLKRITWKDILPWIGLGLVIGGVIWLLWKKYTKKHK
ncbi:MAG: hypothetical protein DRH33_01715 [Candidatus Nealsonbacteria bacterium]|nr:MAG: hypothetical protein DRH33_01715 [Candidatus Nealsonbacteria bacterium]